MHPTSHRFRAGDLELYYEVLGEGPPLVLLHAGFLGIDSSFAKVRPALARRFRTLAIEQQGHGHTPDIDRPLSYEQMVEDTAALLRHAQVSDANVFGWSDGGIVALGLALRHPDLVRKVAIIGAGYGPDAEPPEFRERMAKLTPDNERMSQFRAEYAKVAPDPSRWPALVEKIKTMYASFRGYSPDELRNLRAPLLVLLGDRDFLRLEHAIELYRLVPHGALSVLPNSDHGAPVARAEWVREQVEAFFDEE